MHVMQMHYDSELLSTNSVLRGQHQWPEDQPLRSALQFARRRGSFLLRMVPKRLLGVPSGGVFLTLVTTLNVCQLSHVLLMLPCPPFTILFESQVIVMGIPTVERAVIQEDTKTKTYKLLVEGTGLQVRTEMILSSASGVRLRVEHLGFLSALTCSETTTKFRCSEVRPSSMRVQAPSACVDSAPQPPGSTHASIEGARASPPWLGLLAGLAWHHDVLPAEHAANQSNSDLLGCLDAQCISQTTDRRHVPCVVSAVLLWCVVHAGCHGHTGGGGQRDDHQPCA